MKTIRDIGEFGFIDIIRSKLKQPEGNVTGIGDDCAILPLDDNTSLLVTTDMLLENRHFLLDSIGPEALARKSLAVNLSDISAMGGVPEYAFLSIALPESVSVDWINKFLDALHLYCEQTGVILAGGDTVKSNDDLIINFTVTAKISNGSIKRRSDAKSGDLIACTGFPGDSGAGLKLILQQKDPTDRHEKNLIQHHLDPNINIKEGAFLGMQEGVGAMIDLSDGIQSDAGHIAKASGVSLQFELSQLPLSNDFKTVCYRYGWNPYELAVAAGEDYGLLFTIKGKDAENIKQSFKKRFGYEFAVIGTVRDQNPDVLFYLNEKRYQLSNTGFDHFKS